MSSIFDYLHTTSEMNIENTLKRFAEHADDPDDVIIELDPHKAIFERPFSFRAIAKESDDLDNVVTATLEVNPTINIVFGLPKWINWYEIREGILKSVLHLIENTDWDLAWIHGDSDVALLRKSGKIQVKKGYDFWTEERLKLLTIPYEIAEIPNL